MGFRSFFHRRRLSEIERELIEVRSQFIFAQDMLASLNRKRLRERRSDAREYQRAKAATTARLMAELGRTPQ